MASVAPTTQPVAMYRLAKLMQAGYRVCIHRLEDGEAYCLRPTKPPFYNLLLHPDGGISHEKGSNPLDIGAGDSEAFAGYLSTLPPLTWKQKIGLLEVRDALERIAMVLYVVIVGTLFGVALLDALGRLWSSL